MGVPPSEQDVTNLQFVQEYLNLLTAEINAYNFSDNNPLDSPYCMQRRLPGYDLESAKQSYPSLTHYEKLAFIEGYCEIILLGLQYVQYRWIGQINKVKDGYIVTPFEVFQEKPDLITQRAAYLEFFKPRPLSTKELMNPQDPDEKLNV